VPGNGIALSGNTSFYGKKILGKESECSWYRIGHFLPDIFFSAGDAVTCSPGMKEVNLHILKLFYLFHYQINLVLNNEKHVNL